MPGTSAREAFKRNLSYYMKAANVEQADIVAALRITASTVSDWVNGKKYPRVDAMQRLADFLNVQMSALTAEAEPPELTPEQQTKARIHALVDNLSPADIQRAEAVLQALLATQETQPPVRD